LAIANAGDVAMMVRMALAAGLTVFLPWLTHAQQADCKVSLSQYNQLQPGMSHEEVVRILGCKGKNPVFSLPPNLFERYNWDGNAPDAIMGVTFQNGKLTEKFQSGLR